MSRFTRPSVHPYTTTAGPKSISGGDAFVAYIAAFSSSFDQSFTGYARASWSATWSGDVTGAGSARNENGVDGTVVKLDAPVSLNQLGVKTTGPTVKSKQTGATDFTIDDEVYHQTP
jgi:hypothetical protein